MPVVLVLCILSNGNSFNGLIRMGTSDLMEDYKFTGGYPVLLPTLVDNEIMFFNFTNQRKTVRLGLSLITEAKQVHRLEPMIGEFNGRSFQNPIISPTLKIPAGQESAVFVHTVGPRFHTAFQF